MAPHTAEQEAQEHSAIHASASGSATPTREQKEATEENILGHDAHQKLEVLHVATESHPLAAGAAAIGILAVAILGVRYAMKKKNFVILSPYQTFDGNVVITSQRILR